MAGEQKVRVGQKVIGNTSGADISSVIGSNGLIWKITDSLTGELLGIRDISGFPCFIVDSDGRATVGNGTISPSSMFSVFSTTQGSVPVPRMTRAQRLAISSPVAGLRVYQTDDLEGEWINTSTGWTNVLSSSIVITTSVSITTATTDSNSNPQYGNHVLISNGANNINITVNGVGSRPTTYQKEGTGTITFVQGSGRTLRQVDGTAILNGAVGSTASIASNGTTDSLRISNA